MVYKMYTLNDLSRYFRFANIINILCLLSKILYFRYIPNYILVGCLLDNFDNLSLFISSVIIISRYILLFSKKHPKLIAHKVTALTIISIICTFLTLVLVFNNDMEDLAIEYYSTQSITPRHKMRILIIIISMFIILCLNLYHAVQENENKITNTFVKKNIDESVKLFFIKFIVFSLALTGIFQIHEFQDLSRIGMRDLSSKFFLYIKTMSYILILLWITAIIYYLYTKFLSKKNNKVPK